MRLGLEALAACCPQRVLIHDGARPFPDKRLVDRVLDGLDKAVAAIPCLPLRDTIKRAEGGMICETIDRSALWRAQTPQGFHFDAILAAHRAAIGRELTDDAAVAEAAGLAPLIVDGSEDNLKVTTAEDLAAAERLLAARPGDVRVGQGFDVHPFAPAIMLWICGIGSRTSLSLVGHSDADVGLHALTDAVLGAIGAGDIGMHFPPSDPRWRGAASDQFLSHAADLVRARGGTRCRGRRHGHLRAAQDRAPSRGDGGAHRRHPRNQAPIASASRRRRPRSSALPAAAKAWPRRPSPQCVCRSDDRPPRARPAALASGTGARDLVRRRPPPGHAGDLGLTRRPALRLGDPQSMGGRRAGDRYRDRVCRRLLGRRTIAKTSGIQDPGAIVIDEVAAQWLVLLPAPLDPLSYAAAFVLFRIFDIWKPWPVGWADRRVHGGLGIMLDDLLAAAYAVLVFLVALMTGGASGVRS